MGAALLASTWLTLAGTRVFTANKRAVGEEEEGRPRERAARGVSGRARLPWLRAWMSHLVPGAASQAVHCCAQQGARAASFFCAWPGRGRDPLQYQVAVAGTTIYAHNSGDSAAEISRARRVDCAFALLGLLFDRVPPRGALEIILKKRFPSLLLNVVLRFRFRVPTTWKVRARRQPYAVHFPCCHVLDLLSHL